MRITQILLALNAVAFTSPPHLQKSIMTAMGQTCWWQLSVM